MSLSSSVVHLINPNPNMNPLASTVTRHKASQCHPSFGSELLGSEIPGALREKKKAWKNVATVAGFQSPNVHDTVDPLILIHLERMQL